MSIQIRHFADKDLADFVSLLNEANKGSYEFIPLTKDEVSGRIQKGKLKIFVAEEKDRIRGSATYNDGHWGEEIR